MIKQAINKYYVVPLAAFFLLIFALYNNYPIMSGDSTTYLDSGFMLKVPDERPVFYGLFIRVTSLGASLWLAMFFQSLILSYVLVRFIRFVAPAINNLKLLALMLLISLGTIASWYAGQAMPDIFTPILFLAMANHLLIRERKWDSFAFLLIAILAILTHYSHYMIATLFSLLLLIGSFLNGELKPYKRRAFALLSISTLAWLILFTSNYLGGKGFVSSNASHVFLMGKLAESGVLKTYLDKACPIKDYKICKHIDNLPPVAWEFVWDQSNSPVFKEGGWEANKEEYNTIMRDIISRPKYWPYLAYKSLEATCRQVIQTNIDEGEERPWIKFDKEHPVYHCVLRWFPHEINEFAVSKQNYKILNLKFYDDVYVILLLTSSLMMMFLLKGDPKREMQVIYILLFSFILLNAFTTATFANVNTRLNSRAIWLLPAINIVFIYQIISERLNRQQ